MEDFEKHLVIENPNSSGQGYCPHHTANPHHDILVKYGWQYSHTTRITAIDQSKYAHHTYKNGQWNVGVDCRPGWQANASKSSSGRTAVFYHHKLEKYLKRKSREIARQM